MDAKQLHELNLMNESAHEGTDGRLFRGLLYGDPGAGKTDLAAKIVQAIGGRAAWFTTDSNWVVVQKYPDVASQVRRFKFDSFAQLRLFAQAHNEKVEGYEDFKTIVWDTASTGIDNMLRQMVDLKKYPKEQVDPLVEGRPHYRIVERALSDTVKVLNETDLNVIYLMHIKDPSDADKEKRRFAIRPKAPEASYNVIAQEVQMIGWLHKESKGSGRLLQLEGTLRETGKCQVPGILEKTYPVEEIPNLIRNWQQNL